MNNDQWQKKLNDYLKQTTPLKVHVEGMEGGRNYQAPIVPMAGNESLNCYETAQLPPVPGFKQTDFA